MRKFFAAVAMLLALAVSSLVYAGPASASQKSATCAAYNDSGYRVIVSVDYVIVSGLVDINYVSTVYQHRTAGLWNTSNWASTSTDRVVYKGVTERSITRDPGANNAWYTASPAYNPANGLYVRVDASGSPGGSFKEVSGCRVNF